MISFSIGCLKHHLPLIDDVITVSLLAKVPGNFAGISGEWIEWLRVLVDVMMKSPLEMAWTLPKFNGVVRVWDEEVLQFTENRWRVMLERMRTAIENFPCSMDGVHNDNDLRDDFIGAGLIDATPYGKEFCLCACYKQCMMDCLGEQTICNVYVWYRCSDIVFDASICYDKSCMRWRRVVKNHGVEFMGTDFVLFFVFFSS